MEKLDLYQEKVFDSIKHIDQNGEEFWYARELMASLKYLKWSNFKLVINKAKVSCDLSGNEIDYDFAYVGKIVKAGATSKTIDDYKLSRYACYLIVQNSDPKKKEVALGQTYFAVQTRKMEMSEEHFKNLSEDEKRLYTRINVRNKNRYLFGTAESAGVKNFGKFNNYGYKGLYNGEAAEDIAMRKGIKDNENILDYMGSEELGANLFRITQTDAKLKKDSIHSEADACDTHYLVGKTIRETIKLLNGTMPEDLSTPEKSIIEIEKEKLKRISGGSIFAFDCFNI